ncbi:Crp/Fnr family transcriptional regulator [Nocardia cyriacigeorgica]|uniref:Crp/Fnr family transcriptional regulator n=1 Tax=Nocardia cyriacigeorgica TaxID=135487 RepID=UPI002804CB10|nr:Crp/Fnr family transcriptional regulator [Nocardia cyriacigeorgica]
MRAHHVSRSSFRPRPPSGATSSIRRHNRCICEARGWAGGWRHHPRRSSRRAHPDGYSFSSDDADSRTRANRSTILSRGHHTECAGSRGRTTLRFDILSRRARAELLEVGVRQRWSTGAVLLREGDESDTVLVIESGRVKVSSSAASGKQVVLGIRGPGELLGELGAIDGGARSATITAISPVIAAVLQGKNFRDLLISDGALTFELLCTVVVRLREADRQRLDFGTHTVTERLARLLLEYARRYGRTEADRVIIDLSLTQAELAHAAGASREAVAKALRHLREIGAIRTARRCVELLRPGLLAQVADGLPNVYSDADRRMRPR